LLAVNDIQGHSTGWMVCCRSSRYQLPVYIFTNILEDGSHFPALPTSCPLGSLFHAAGFYLSSRNREESFQVVL